MQKKEQTRACSFSFFAGKILAFLSVALVELVHTTCGVDELLLAGVEGMAVAGDFNFDQRVFVAVFPLDGVLRVDGRLGQEGEIGGYIFEDDRPVIRMDIFFHCSLL